MAVGSPNSPYYYGSGGYRPTKPPPITGYGSYYPPNSTATVGAYTPPVPEAPSAPQAPQTPQAPQRPAIDFSHLDFSNDPILSRIRALGQESIAQAEAEAQAARTRLVIGYGDQNLGLKLGLSKKTQKQAANNPFSTLAELKRTYQRRNVFEIDRPLSDQANLFYSTERGRQRALSGEQDLRDRAKAEAAVQEQSSSISNALIQAKMAQQAQLISAQQDAYNRALQQALYAAGV
jgi:hypothetical protein